MKRFGNSYWLIAMFCIFTAVALVSAPVSAKAVGPKDKAATLKEKMREAVALITQATEMAAKADETGDLDLAKKAMAIHSKAKVLLDEVAKAVKETGDPEMEVATCDIFNSYVTALDMLISMADKVAKVSTDPKAVRAAEELKKAVTDEIAMADLTLQKAALSCSSSKEDTAEAFEEDRRAEKVGDEFKPEEASKR